MTGDRPERAEMIKTICREYETGLIDEMGFIDRLNEVKADDDEVIRAQLSIHEE